MIFFMLQDLRISRGRTLMLKKKKNILTNCYLYTIKLIKGAEVLKF